MKIRKKKLTASSSSSTTGLTGFTTAVFPFLPDCKYKKSVIIQKTSWLEEEKDIVIPQD